MLALLRFVCFVPLFYALLDEPANVMTRALLRALHLTIEREYRAGPNTSLNEVGDINGTSELPPSEKPVEAVDVPKPSPCSTVTLPEQLLLPSAPHHIPMLC
jgi:hypothetical protein